MVVPFGKAHLKPAMTITWPGTGAIRVSKAVIFD